MSEQRRPVVVVGSINMDLVSRVPAIPRAGQTILGTGFMTHPGGKGANQAVGVARLGYPVKMIGMLGKDAFGKQLRDHLDADGVDTTEIGTSAEATGNATILVEDSGQNCIVVTPGANASLTSEILRRKADVLRGAGLVLAQLEIPLDTVLCLVEMCRSMNVPLILDPAPAVSLPAEILSGVTWFTPNETEAEFYANGIADEPSLLNKLFGMGIQRLILKRGAHGCVVIGEDRVPRRVPSPAVHAVDTTAAGDAFNAAFAVALMQGNDPVKSAQFATAAAAISVTRAGAQPSLPTTHEVSEAMLASSGVPS
jgi:ribokinase